MRRVEIVARLDRGDEVDRHQVRALVEQLEHRVLRIGADPAPGDRRGRAVDRRAVGRDATCRSIPSRAAGDRSGSSRSRSS